MDCAKVGYQNIPSTWKYDTFITLNSPLLLNTDNYGLIPGLVQSANDLLSANLSRYQNGSCVKWGFFIPSSSGFGFINKLILQGQVCCFTFNLECVKLFKYTILDKTNNS